MGHGRGRRDRSGRRIAGDVAERVAGLAPVLAPPALRGWVHAGAFPLTAAAGLVLVALAPAGGGRWATAVFAVTATLLFGTSALFHLGRWSTRTALLLRRLDHSNIFLTIAGSYTPFAVLLLPWGSARTLLLLVWSGAVVGVLFRVLWTAAPRALYVPVYLVMSWMAIAWVPAFWRHGGPAVALLVMGGGLLYTVGAVVYGTRRPNPSPRWFGFHEVFHVLTVVAFTAHFVGVALAAHGAGAPGPAA